MFVKIQLRNARVVRFFLLFLLLSSVVRGYSVQALQRCVSAHNSEEFYTILLTDQIDAHKHHAILCIKTTTKTSTRNQPRTNELWTAAATTTTTSASAHKCLKIWLNMCKRQRLYVLDTAIYMHVMCVCWRCRCGRDTSDDCINGTFEQKKKRTKNKNRRNNHEFNTKCMHRNKAKENFN